VRGSPFTVFTPKFVGFQNVEASEADNEAFGQSFFAGVDSHEKGAAVWAKHYDPNS
jgi:hypothetical protein